jgi:two-component system, chemotaxis family, CheB/CheR fusion protein
VTDGAPTKPQQVEAFEELLEFLKLNRGFDFTGYKRSSLERRIFKRMQEVGIDGFADYQDYLEVHPDEFRELFNTICINVTGFFRDKPSWDYMAKDVVPALNDSVGPGDPLRVWCAGCATGEEAYTAAIVVAETLGLEAYAERAKIYATDVDEDALAVARQGTYPKSRLESVTPELAERYFEAGADGFTFRKDLRRTVIFGRNDLAQDSPISRIDLLICRNTLMYFNAETQTRILAHFHFSLNQRGYLFLGKSEMLITRAEVFTPVSTKGRVFRKVPGASLRERLLGAADGDGGDGGEVGNLSHLREGSFDSGPVAQIVVDRSGQLVLANQQARSLFRIAPSDLGRPVQDLDLSYRPTDIRSALDEVAADRHPVSLGVVEWTSPGGEQRHTESIASPIVSASGALLGSSITFADVARYERLRSELERSKRELEMAYEELQSTVEELETTNEELQSTNEELETTNEELRSTNEELETMNEELQSTNEELETINDELRQRTGELDRVNAFLESILLSLGVAVAVLDREQRIQVWNEEAEDLWGLRGEEVAGQHLPSLDIGLPVEKLRRPIRNASAGNAEGNELVLDATNRRGRAIRCKVTCLPLIVASNEIQGVIVLMESQKAS